MTDFATAEAIASVLVLASAFLHALVNMLVKASSDGLVTRGCMNGVALLVALPFVLVVPAPDSTLWPVLLLSMLVHGLYPFFLVEAYRKGDLSSAFPVARGTAPLFVALFGVAALEQDISAPAIAGIVVVSLAIASLGLEKIPWRSSSRPVATMASAVATGLIVAVYTVIDAVGLKMAGSAATYIVWLFILDGAFVAAAVALARRHTLTNVIRPNWRWLLLSGVLGVLSYGLALVALRLGSMAEIAALRETSVLFAVFLSAMILRERVSALRWTAAGATLLGILLMRAG